MEAAMYVRVYAPNGEPFDVTRERADSLILQHGWTQTRPVRVETKTKRRRKSTEESALPADAGEDAFASEIEATEDNANAS
ncbi:hypothetical protein RPALISO_53 [Ruegeria phage RpAliso]|nr:hypothetical protein RPALISO_53 [Ruegeria phage RpAliso]